MHSKTSPELLWHFFDITPFFDYPLVFYLYLGPILASQYLPEFLEQELESFRFKNLEYFRTYLNEKAGPYNYLISC